LRSRLSIAELQQEESMQELVLKVRRRMKTRNMQVANRAGAIPESAFTGDEQAEHRVNLVALKNIFLKRSGDLFSFVMEHDFKEPMDDPRRVGVFCQLASRYASELEFSEEIREYDGLEVAVVYGRNGDVG
jgi:hypothetical protein